MSNILPFSEILNSLIENANMTSSQVVDELKLQGIKLTNQRISDYRNAVTNVPYDKARILLNFFEYYITEDELLESLEINKIVVKENDYGKNEYLINGIRIKYRNLLPDKEPEQVMVILQDRIQNLYGEEKKLSAYLTDLISKDLKTVILEREDEK